MEWWKKYEGLIPAASHQYPEENWMVLESSNRNHLQTYRYPCSNPRAILFMFHGFGAHANTLSHLAARFSQENMLVLSLDYENHGNSGGTRGKLTNIDFYVNDARTYIEKSKEVYPDLPIFLLGESLGGHVCVRLSLRLSDVQGMILLAPSIGIRKTSKSLPFRFFSFLGSILPWVQMFKPDFAALTRNVHAPEAALEDPCMSTNRVYLSALTAFKNSLEDLMPRYKDVYTPFLLIQGGKDSRCSAEIAKVFAREANSSDKKMLLIEEMYHGVSAEENIYELMDVMADWFSNRIK